MAWKAVVFDLDGVLLDTEPIQHAAWIEVLKPLGISVSKDDYLRYVGKAGKWIVSDMAERKGLENPSEVLEKRKLAAKRMILEKPLNFMPYVREAVGYFRDMGFKLAVASGSPKDELDIKLRMSGLDKFFGTVVSNNDVEKGKPEPDIYLKAAKLLGVDPSECISFEDTSPGVQSAKSAGLACFAVPNELTKEQDFSAADRVFGSLKEAVEHIKGVTSSRT